MQRLGKTNLFQFFFNDFSIENSEKMFITAVQNIIRRELFRGSMHRGKYRYVRPIKIKEMKLLQEEYMREDRVTRLLLNPYLTQVIKMFKVFEF